MEGDYLIREADKNDWPKIIDRLKGEEDYSGYTSLEDLKIECDLENVAIYLAEDRKTSQILGHAVVTKHGVSQAYISLNCVRHSVEDNLWKYALDSVKTRNYCDIGDASRGSLSSYAYIILVIHFLQTRSPPVLPVLQELCNPYCSIPPTHTIDGWETYFFSDLSSLRQTWSGWGKNKETLGELWVGFLRYYTEKFNPRQDVVQIRRAAPLTKFEKLWNDKCLAIEDPFDLNHNLASGLSKKSTA